MSFGTVRSMIAGTLLLAAVAGCGREDRGGEAVPVGPAGPTRVDTDPLWAFTTRLDRPACSWWRAVVTAPGSSDSTDVAEFPTPCDAADVAWSGDHAIVWLATPTGNQLYTLTFGATPVRVDRPPGTLHAVGFDDVPLVFTTPNPATTDDVRAFALEGGAWVEREHAKVRLPAMASWKSQRGVAARRERSLTNLRPLPAGVVAQLGYEPSEAAIIADIGASIVAHAERGGGAGLIPIERARVAWLGFEVAGVPLAIRYSHDHLVPDLRRFAGGTWAPFARPNVSGDRFEIWKAGVEIRGRYVLVTSDGVSPVLYDAITGAHVWGQPTTALTLFAPR